MNVKERVSFFEESSMNKRVKSCPNYFTLLDFNLLHLVVSYLDNRDVIVFDRSLCDKSLRIEFLKCLKLTEYKATTGKQRDWATARLLKIVGLFFNKEFVPMLTSVTPQVVQIVLYVEYPLQSCLLLALSHCLSNCPDLRSLQIKNVDTVRFRKIGSATCSVSKKLYTTPKLQHLSLKNVNLHYDEVSDLANALQALPELRLLEINGEVVSLHNSFPLSNSLLFLPLLEELTLCGCVNTKYSSAIFARDVGADLSGVPCLTYLNVSSNCMDDKGMKLLSRNLVHTPLLKSLDISNNDVSSRGIQSLFSSLLKNVRNLKLLDASNNPVDSEKLDHHKDLMLSYFPTLSFIL